MGLFCVSFEFCLFLLLVWAIACVLNLDTCCDCSWLCSVFASQRYLNLTGLLLCGLEKFHAPASTARETPQLNIVLFSVALSLMLHMFQIKTKCARPVRPAHKRKATTVGDLLRGCCKSLWASNRCIRARPAGWLVGILLVVVPFTASTRSCWGCS